MLTLLVSYSGHLGGAERLLVDAAGGLEGERCLACPPGTLADHASAAGLRVFPLRSRSLELRSSWRHRAAGPLHLAAHAAEARGLARSLDPDLVVAWNMRSGLACAAALGRRGRRPAVVFQHNDLLPGRLIGALVRAAARRVDRVIALSRTVLDDLDPGGRLGTRASVVYPGVDLERFAAVGPPPEAPTALLLGALVTWKRPELALEAVALAARDLPELRLLVAGEPLGHDGEEVLVALRERSTRPDLDGRVTFCGSMDARDALGGASCLLHCAEREPFGLVVLEALASGRPVVAPAAGGPAEVLDEGCGRLYRPGDARAAAAALVEVLGTPSLAGRLGSHGRRRAEERFELAQARRRWRAALPPVPSTGGVAGEGLALVTVTHNSADELRALLGSVERHLPEARVVVVDSGSSDRSADVAREWRGRATVEELDVNAGFGRACNFGVAHVSEPVTALVNPDVELLDASLGALAEEALRPELPDRLLAPLVLQGDGRREDSVHPVPTSGADLVRSLVPPAALPGRLGVALAPWRSHRPRRVGWAVGCCLVARTSTLRRLGPFDERIFLYGEDMDLGLRARAAGVETWFRPEARVLHHRAHSTARAFGGEAFELLARQRREVLARQRGVRRARIDDAAQAVTFASRILVKKVVGRPVARERRQLEAARRVSREPLDERERAAA